MENVAKLISEESVVKLVDGTEIKGSKQVAELILGCCEGYNDGYKSALFRLVGISILSGLVVYTGYRVIKMGKNKNKKID